MKLIKIIICTALLFTSLFVQAQEKSKHHFENKNYIGTQAFVLLSFVLDPSPEFYQLSYGRRLSAKDEISIEAITWRYDGPIGRPYGEDYEQVESNFPGDIKAAGIGLAYKRLIWKGAFAQIHSQAMRQTFRDENEVKIQNGFQLFNTLRFGYQFKVFKNKFFIAPSVAFTYWPINTNLPTDFQVEEDKWPNYFLFEPGLHIGFAF